LQDHFGGIVFSRPYYR